MFEDSTPSDFYNAADAISWYRTSTLAIVRQTGRYSRRMFLPDLRASGRETSPGMQLLPHFAPVAKRRANLTDPPFEDAALPVRQRNYSSDLRRLVEFLKPIQLMANYDSEEQARGICKYPPTSLI